MKSPYRSGEADDVARLGRGRVLPLERGRGGHAGLLEVGHQSTVWEFSDLSQW